jgi:hypothetical protein
LRVLLDVPRVPAEENYAGLDGEALSVPDELALLTALTKWDDVECYWVEADARVADPGALHVSPPDLEDKFWPFVVYCADGTRSHRAVDIRPRLSEAATAQDTNSAEFMVALARELGIDLLVTDRTDLLSSDVPEFVAANAVDVRTGLAMIGLRLRLVDIFAVTGPVARFSFDKQMFLWSGAHRFPSSARWGKSLFSYSQAIKQDNPMYLGSAFYYRLTRALHQRDLLHCALLSEDDHDAPDAVFEALDYFMINIIAAFDVVARIAHVTFGIDDQSTRAGWQRRAWLSKIRAQSPDLANVLAPGTIDYKALRACAILRNTIHGEPPRGTKVHPPHRGRHTHIGLSTEDTQQLRLLLGPTEELPIWGWHDSTQGIDLVNPGVLVERLFPLVLATLGKLVDLIPVEQLPGVDANLVNEPTRESASLGLGGRTRTSLLLGLTPPLA